MMTTSNRRTRGIGHRVAFVGLLVVAVFGAGAAVVAAAAFTTQPAGFLGAGLVVLALGVGVASRVLPAGHRVRGGLVAVVVLSVIGGWALLWPGSSAVPAAPPGTRWVDLATGSRLAYQELPPAGDRGEPPVIFLHGGPGVADMAGDLPHLRRLADAGWPT